jgi:hypothetical protein
LDQIPKPVFVALLRAGDVWHGNDHRRLRQRALNSSRTMGGLRRRDGNSRIKVQSVRKDSSVADHAMTIRIDRVEWGPELLVH